MLGFVEIESRKTFFKKFDGLVSANAQTGVEIKIVRQKIDKLTNVIS